MRVLVMERCVRPRNLRLRSSRGLSGHWYHVHRFSLRPEYEFEPDNHINKVKICRDAIKRLRHSLESNGFGASNFRYYITF